MTIEAQEWPAYLRALIAYNVKPERTVIGMLSGTSADGMTAVVARVQGRGTDTKISVLGCETWPYPAPLDERIVDVFSRDTGSVDRVAQADIAIGEFCAEVAGRIAKRANLTLKDVDLIVSFGQVTYQVIEGQRAEHRWLGDKAITSFLVLGSGSVIAQRTGVTTVTNLQQRDISVGGLGVPGLTYMDWVVFGDREKGRIVQNIGGIANPTVIPAGAELKDVFSFDAGPGNMIIDGLVRQLTEGELTHDRDGEIAASGRVDAGLLEELLKHPFIRQAPPKAAARQIFGPAYAAEVRARGKALGLIDEDIVATATQLTAETLAYAYREFVFPRAEVDEVYIAGGGAKNPTLMERIRETLAPIPVMTIADLGVPVDAREALGAIVNGNETILGHASNNPSATGALERVIVGDISPCGAEPDDYGHQRRKIEAVG